MTRPLLFLGKLISLISKTLSLGSGATWPGEIALKIDPDILQSLIKDIKKGIVIVAGTNGKTTIAKLIVEMIRYQYPGKSIVHNDSGANLLNGIVSAFIQRSQLNSKTSIDWAVIEVDENTLPYVLKNLQLSQNQQIQKIIVLTNLFRDQLDRYGEVDAISKKWLNSIRNISDDITIIANADDPMIAYVGLMSKKDVRYYGIDIISSENKDIEHATDSIFCPGCGKKLKYEIIYYSHIGHWWCPSCHLKRPDIDKITLSKSALPGLYNIYNSKAAVIVAHLLHIDSTAQNHVLNHFSPAFGRQEEFDFKDKKVKIFLSKNPVGFNESLKTVIELGAKNILLVLNDRIPDGRDVSWIWDVDFEMIPQNVDITASGDRVFDMALRIKYTFDKSQISNLKIFMNLEDAILSGLEKLAKDETLYILPTYSAMLEVRQILKGRKIL